MLTQVPFYFLRHGETDWNHRRIIQGWTDTDLSAAGIAQVEAVKAAVEALPIATICCSALLRAKRSMEIVNRSIKKPVVMVPELRESKLGAIDGQPSNGEWREPWVQGGPMPGGETFQEYIDRVIVGFYVALAQPGPVLAIGHGGNFWALERYGLIEPGFRVPNCTLFKLEPPRDSKFWSVKLLAKPDGPSLAIGEAP